MHERSKPHEPQQRAKLFQTGGSQAVRLPKEFRFEGQEEVRISRQGHRVILEPVKRTWSPEFLKMIATPSDFPYPEEPLPVEPGPDFDSIDFGSD
ncbi:MAG TPA: type II toxin-antitoxin system VapB family antitoxin [Thermoanaerobaculia bacterium]|nr:type II toxin-antitoxin system VapB family antitoxin [Thermoanaerobaculia bacterium]